MKGLFSVPEEKFLQEAALGRMCTIDRNGYPHCVRVDFLYHNDQVYVGSATPRIWHYHISVNPKVCFEIDVYKRGENGLFDFRGLMFKGEAHRIKSSEDRKRVAELLRERHPDAPFGIDPIVVCIVPQKRYRWGPWGGSGSTSTVP